MKYFLILLILSLLIISSCKESDNPTEAPAIDPNGELAILATMKDATGTGLIKVMTRNIYIGADVDIVLEAEDPNDIPVLVAQAYATLEGTDFTHRATMLADEIAKTEPHLIGLQEVTMSFRQSPGDLAFGGQEPATELEYDYLSTLMEALVAKGLNYEIALVVQNADVELPMLTGFDNQGIPTFDDVRIVDQDVILARSDVQVSKPMKGNYQAFLPVDPALGINIYRGYVSVEAKVNDISFRFVNTHLEAFNIEELRLAQAAELVAIHAVEELPVVMVGDFNTPAPGNSTYQFVLNSGYNDVWDHNTETYSYNAAGNTFGHNSELSNSDVNMFQRIDFVFVRSATDPEWGPVVVIGDEFAERSNNLWPSDHAGVITMLKF